MKKIFLSHSAQDSNLAHVLKTVIEQCSLGTVTVWFSSDTSSRGGMIPGGPWFDQLSERLAESQLFIAILTPKSLDNLWLHYEAGCAAIQKVPILPVTIGASVNDVRLPMSLYNVHSIGQPADLTNLLKKIYAKLDVPHRDEMLELPAQRAALEMLSVSSSENPGTEIDNSTDADRLMRLIDQRFMDLIRSLPKSDAPAPTQLIFTVPMKVSKKGKVLRRFSLDIAQQDSLFDVASACYFRIMEHVSAYSYLAEWIIRDTTLGENLVFLDYAEHINANAVVKPGHEYEIVLLSRPFDPRKDRAQKLS
jgi:hypothetical protein